MLALIKNIINFCFCALVVQLFLPGTAAGQGGNSESANYRWTGVERVVAIGDIHGDYKAFIQILLSMKLIDQRGNWIGGKTHLVLIGDLIAGKSGSKEVLDLTMSLERAAAQAGGRVHSLLGNHDLIVASGDFSRMSKAERAAFVPEEIEKKKKRNQFLRDLFAHRGLYAEWMASRPLAIVINDRLYIHAGVDAECPEIPLPELNRIAKQWIRYFQGIGPRPAQITEWVIGLKNGVFYHDIGPAFTRMFKVRRGHPNEMRRGAMERWELDRVLKFYDVIKMMLGHVPTRDGKIQTEHPVYGERVASLDSSISSKKHGNLSALEIVNGREISHTIERPKTDPALVGQCRSLFGH